MNWTFNPLPLPPETHYGFIAYCIFGGGLYLWAGFYLLQDRLFGLLAFVSFIFAVGLFIGYNCSFYPNTPLNEQHTAEFIGVRPEQEKTSYSCGTGKMPQTCYKYTSVLWGEFKLESGNKIWVKINPNHEMPQFITLYKQEN